MEYSSRIRSDGVFPPPGNYDQVVLFSMASDDWFTQWRESPYRTPTSGSSGSNDLLLALLKDGGELLVVEMLRLSENIWKTKDVPSSLDKVVVI